MPSEQICHQNYTLDAPQKNVTLVEAFMIVIENDCSQQFFGLKLELLISGCGLPVRTCGLFTGSTHLAEIRHGYGSWCNKGHVSEGVVYSPLFTIPSRK